VAPASAAPGLGGGAEHLAVDARRLVAGLADLACVVRGEERADDELAGLDGCHRVTDFFDDADVFVAHVKGLSDLVGAAVRPQIRPADAGGRQPDDRVGRLQDLRFLDILHSDVTGGVHHDTTHEDLL
jgi:hypothetical protein